MSPRRSKRGVGYGGALRKQRVVRKKAVEHQRMSKRRAAKREADGGAIRHEDTVMREAAGSSGEAGSDAPKVGTKRNKPRYERFMRKREKSAEHQAGVSQESSDTEEDDGSGGGKEESCRLRRTTSTRCGRRLKKVTRQKRRAAAAGSAVQCRSHLDRDAAMRIMSISCGVRLRLPTKVEKGASRVECGVSSTAWSVMPSARLSCPSTACTCLQQLFAECQNAL